MAPRALWKGYLQIAALSCGVGLYTAASPAERVALNTINRETGRRARREYVDSLTGDPVEKEDQVRGYEAEKDVYIVLDQEELASAAVKSDKTLVVSTFIPLAEMDETFLDNPYYLAPADQAARGIFAVIREGLRRGGAGAIARAVLFRRARNLLIRALGDGLIATTLKFDYEVRPAAEAFSGIADLAIKGEMLDLAKHIIKMKAGAFDPSDYHDRYETALTQLIQAKIQGLPIPAARRAAPAKAIDLMQALRDSAGLREERGRGKAHARKPATAERGRAKRSQGKRGAN
jgi:DNA end-binding protein Ku